MSGAMFKAMNASSKKESSGSSALSDIKNMVIVISERPGKAFKDDIKKLTRSGEYQSMSVIRDGKDVVEFYVVTQNDKVKEFLMIVMDSSDCVVMAITGDDLSVKGISQIASQAAGVEGIELEEF